METYQEDFKAELYKFLSKIPDQPRLGGQVPEATFFLFLFLKSTIVMSIIRNYMGPGN
jgi:hypothetical protein